MPPPVARSSTFSASSQSERCRLAGQVILFGPRRNRQRTRIQRPSGGRFLWNSPRGGWMRSRCKKWMRDRNNRRSAAAAATQAQPPSVRTFKKNTASYQAEVPSGRNVLPSCRADRRANCRLNALLPPPRQERRTGI
jgi:hypothetical protein